MNIIKLTQAIDLFCKFAQNAATNETQEKSSSVEQEVISTLNVNDDSNPVFKNCMDWCLKLPEDRGTIFDMIIKAQYIQKKGQQPQFTTIVELVNPATEIDPRTKKSVPTRFVALANQLMGLVKPYIKNTFDTKIKASNLIPTDGDVDVAASIGIDIEKRPETTDSEGNVMTGAQNRVSLNVKQINRKA